MVLYRDLSKLSNDVLRRDYIHSKPWDVELQHASKNPLFTHCASLSNALAMDAASAIKYNTSNGSFEVKAATNSTTLDVSYKPDVSGLTLGGRFEKKRSTGKASGNETLDVTCDYSFAPAHFRANFNPLNRSWGVSILSSAKLSECATLRAGGEATSAADGGISRTLGVAVIGQCKDISWVTSVKTTPCTSSSTVPSLIGNVHAKANTPGAAEVSAEVTHNLTESRSQISFGGLWHLDFDAATSKSTTILKAKISQDAKVAASLSHRFSPSVLAIIGTEVDVSDPSKVADTAKFGVKFNISAI